MTRHRVWQTLWVGAIFSVSTVSWAAAATDGAAPQSDKPIEISSDKLDVLQDQNKAIFTGNVIAVQGTSNLRAKVMTVFYRQDGAKAAKKDATVTAVKPAVSNGAADAPSGIYKIEATGDVVYTTPTEAATGDTGIYNVDTKTIDIVGQNVVLTRGQNVLKGTKLNYNMDTGRSVLTAGGTTTDVGNSGKGTKPVRVHGLFVPQSDPKPSGAK